ncbi:MAG: hypothetical protein HUK25_10360 [Treponema sp.]|nr:hypothetical protein [Treponema sp.]
MQTNFIHATESPEVQTQGKIIREGSSVFVRILSSHGNGKYTASVAGIKIIVKSLETLKPGQVFTGKIEVQNGTTVISKNNLQSLTLLQDIKTLNLTYGGNLSSLEAFPELSALLQSMNLETDSLSLQILLQYKQLGMKLDAKTMNKIRKMALKSENPKKTVEKLVSLAQKGIDISSIKLLNDYDFPFNAQNQNNKQNNKFLTDTTPESMLSEIKSFISSVLSGNLENKPGILTLMNHSGVQKDISSEYTWIMFPLEIWNLEEDKINGNGLLKILLGSNDRKMKQMNLELNYQSESYRFLLNTTGSKITGFKYALSPQNTVYSKVIEKNLSKYHPEQVSYSSLEGNSLDFEDISFAGGFV